MLVPLACPFVVFGQLLWIVRVYGATPQASLEPNRLPQVDLGYAVYQASSYNVSVMAMQTNEHVDNREVDDGELSFLQQPALCRTTAGSSSFRCAAASARRTWFQSGQ